MKNNIYQGLITALVTPFKNNDNIIDYDALNILVDHQIKSGIKRIILCGSTGESVLLSFEEIINIIQHVKNYTKNKDIKIIGSISTANPNYALKLAEKFENINVDGIMCSCPYYLKPTQNGLFNFFKSIANNTKLPIMLYDIPSRTGIKLRNETIYKLAEINNIIAIKDAANDFTRPSELIRYLPKNFTLLSGDDISAIPYILQGGNGSVSVASNIIPNQLNKIVNEAIKGNFTLYRNSNATFLNLYKLLFIEPNPTPVKYALSLMNLCNQNTRPPLEIINQTNKELIKDEMIKLKII